MCTGKTLLIYEPWHHPQYVMGGGVTDVQFINKDPMLLQANMDLLIVLAASAESAGTDSTILSNPLSECSLRSSGLV